MRKILELEKISAKKALMLDARIVKKLKTLFQCWGQSLSNKKKCTIPNSVILVVNTYTNILTW